MPVARVPLRRSGNEICKVSLGAEGRACNQAAAPFALWREAQTTESRARAERNARKRLEVAHVAQEAVGRRERAHLGGTGEGRGKRRLARGAMR